LPAAPILCADTTVALGRIILGKPADAADAARTLALLAGRTHRVITAVAVATSRRSRWRLSVSRVRFAPLSAAEIARYVASGEPFGKAGAYAIQSAAAAWIERIEGSYTGIMGLPLHETAALLREAGVDVNP
jgi:septum formation protein